MGERRTLVQGWQKRQLAATGAQSGRGRQRTRQDCPRRHRATMPKAAAGMNVVFKSFRGRLRQCVRGKDRDQAPCSAGANPK
jgi:hypothetical protein